MIKFLIPLASTISSISDIITIVYKSIKNVSQEISEMTKSCTGKTSTVISDEQPTISYNAEKYYENSRDDVVNVGEINENSIIVEDAIAK
ncbi:MAG: hypothetical protein ISN64_00980 [Rickettsia sp.]|nr:hypothetical protein [Rickettsia sp.]